MKKILKLGIVGGGQGSWIGNIHRIASRIDGKYKIFAGSFSRNVKISTNFAHVKPGHPEGYIDAFANIYNEVADRIISKNNKKTYYYPTAYEGLLTAKFIQTCVDSSNKKKWVKF